MVERDALRESAVEEGRGGEGSSGECLRTLEGHDGCVNSAACSPAQQKLQKQRLALLQREQKQRQAELQREEKKRQAQLQKCRQVRKKMREKELRAQVKAKVRVMNNVQLASALHYMR